MNKLSSTRKSPAGAPGAKALITATSLAITLGGWAAFTRANGDTAGPANPPPAIIVRPSTELMLAPQLLPTIVPAPPLPPKLAITHPPVILATLLSDSAPIDGQAVVPLPQAATPVAELPAAVQLPIASAPPLRAVSPPPVAQTRSSR
jgi:hypothetical protein